MAEAFWEPQLGGPREAKPLAGVGMVPENETMALEGRGVRLLEEADCGFPQGEHPQETVDVSTPLKSRGLRCTPSLRPLLAVLSCVNCLPSHNLSFFICRVGGIMLSSQCRED